MFGWWAVLRPPGTVYFLQIVLVMGNSAFLFTNNLSYKRRISSVGWTRYTNRFKLWILIYKSEFDFDNILNESGERVNLSFIEMLAGFTLRVCRRSIRGIIEKSNNLLPATSLCRVIYPLLPCDLLSKWCAESFTKCDVDKCQLFASWP